MNVWVAMFFVPILKSETSSFIETHGSHFFFFLSLSLFNLFIDL